MEYSEATTPERLLQACSIGRRLTDNDGRWLLRDISLQLSSGTRMALVGTTGSGKTLLLRALAWLDSIEEGELLWQGRAIEARRLPEFRGQCVYLHQRPAMVEGSVEDNLRLPFLFQSHRHRHFDAGWAAGFFARAGLPTDFLSREAEKLSGGERQIAALARALQLQPRVLLLDEPTAALDADSTAMVESLLQDWYNRSDPPVAWIWVSHDTSQVERVSDQIVTLREGRLAPSSTTRI